MKNKNRSIIVDFGDENNYQTVISEGKSFLEFVLAYILSLGFQLLHKSHCTGGGNCFTRHSHYDEPWKGYGIEGRILQL